jgi:adenine phosphoribosyltransferase
MEKQKKYLSLINDQTNSARCDVTPIFKDREAFAELVFDLIAPFVGDSIEYVAGIDALGFVLGSAMAVRLQKGFIPIRKEGKLPVPADIAEFIDYSSQKKALELAEGSCKFGDRVLLVDEWIETGSQVQAAIRLLEKQGATIIGIASICIDDNDATAIIKKKYRCHTVR